MILIAALHSLGLRHQSNIASFRSMLDTLEVYKTLVKGAVPLSSDYPRNKDRTYRSRSPQRPIQPTSISKTFSGSLTQVKSVDSSTKSSNISSTNSVGLETGAEDDKKESKLILMNDRHGSTKVAESHKATLKTFVSADYITGLPPLPQRKPRGRRAKLLMSNASANSSDDANVKSVLQKDSVQSAIAKLASQSQQTSEQVSTGDSNIINKLSPVVSEDNRPNSSVEFKGDQPTKKPYRIRPKYPPGSIPATDLESQISRSKSVFPSGNNNLLVCRSKSYN